MGYTGFAAAFAGAMLASTAAAAAAQEGAPAPLFVVTAPSPVVTLAEPAAAAPPVAAPAPADDAAPRPPEGVAASYVPPARDASGWVTPNRGLSAEETSWHVRVALNVAALGCRGPADAATAAAYNAMLAAHRLPLAAAAHVVEGQYRTRHGAEWQARYDDAMTRLYNYWAQPPAHAGFCAAAEALLREAGAVEPAAFPAFAAAALPRLEAPFTAFYAAWDGYRARLADWRGRHAPVAIAAAVPAVMVASR